MDEFVKYDWNEIDSIDLRGTGLDDNKWDVFVNNAYLFPNLKEIHLCTYLFHPRGQQSKNRQVGRFG